MTVNEFITQNEGESIVNYYVVSPNAWNDGNCTEYLNYMKQRHVVFMGWDANNKYGRIFANMQIGDRVIVAQGANWQKRSFFAGIVDSKPTGDNESGYDFTQYCELRSFVELEEDELPFSTECTSGNSRCPRAIHRLYNWKPADAKLIRRVEKLIKQHEFSYSLREIANWSINKRVSIPALQRGLVWAPLQVEMLWDSIFRGFPIGSFVITKSIENKAQTTESITENTSYFLLDGQQRYNAITLGFQGVNNESKAVLWLDLLPPTNTNSTRRFWFKVTTSSHPWGYGNDDNCSLLGWQSYRAALKAFTGKDDVDRIGLRDVSLNDTWPFRSGCPIRMSDATRIYRNLTTHLPIDNALEKFEENVWNLLKTGHPYRGIWQDTEDNRNIIMNNIDKLYHQLELLDDYRITANILNNQMIENEEDDLTGTTNLENLFTRLNTLGTPISPYDLRYSAIKAYWGSIKETNDEIASRIMPAAHLAVLAFRIAMTIDKLEYSEEKTPKLANVPTVSQIRNFGKNRDCRTSKIVEELYKDQGTFLKRIIENVEERLCVAKQDKSDSKNGLPPVLRTNIIYESQDLYLLLTIMAYKGIHINGIWGTLLWIHWFSISPKKDICDYLLNLFVNNCDISIEFVMNSLIEKNWIFEPISSENFKKLLPSSYNDLTPDWSFSNYRVDSVQYPWMNLFDRLLWNRQLMIFAEREYFNTTFDYDPALTNFNSGHNKPWDVDHIVPQAWMKRQGKQYGVWKGFCTQWLWSIGNLAAIPFSINRSKNDKAEWDTYCKYAEKLMFDDSIQDLAEDNLTYDNEKAYLFGLSCLNRIIRFYNDLRQLVPSCSKNEQ